MSSLNPLPFLRPLLATTALLFGAVSVRAASPDDLVKQASVLDDKLKAAEALELYLQASKAKPNNPDLYVRIARQYRHLMADADSRDEKVRLGALALSYGQQAAALAPNDAEAQLSTAITYGKMITLQPQKDQVKSSIRIREAAEKAVRLDPKNDLAWHVLGKWHRVVASVSSVKRSLSGIIYEKLPPASNADAVNCLQKAIALNPNRLMHHVELGRTYAQMGQTQEARRCLEKGLSMPNHDKDDPDAKAHAREALQSLLQVQAAVSQ